MLARRDLPRVGAAFVFACGIALNAGAAPVLLGDTVSVELKNTLFGDFSNVVAVTTGVEVFEGDGSAIGGILLSGEFIDVSDLSITFRLFGGDDSDVVEPGPPRYLGLGLGSAAEYLLSGLFDPSLARIVGVTLTATDLINAAVGTTVLFDDHSLSLRLGSLGILESSSNLGTLRVDLHVEELAAQPVPEPSTFSLLMVCAAFAAGRSRRQIGRCAGLASRRGFRCTDAIS